MMKKWRLILMALLSIFVLSACSGNDDDGEEGALNDGSEMEEIDPDLEGIPDIVAEVNGEEISRETFELTYLSQFQQFAMEAQMYGQELDQDQLKEELAESMIAQELLSQEAERRNFLVADNDIEELISELVDINDLESEDILFELYEEQGMSEEELREQLALQIKLDQLIEDEGKDITVSAEQVEEAYEELLTVYEDMEDENELPPLEEIEADLEEQIRAEEESELIFALIEDLRNDAEIINNF
ncbi:SurA N-terminal domain-containing protein [Amphibacillus sp. Q70]|uniref:SurA N-terminal domain-containing protein n=1 Tax=Amphibacillus sp. Q70 TaxID=3453416 RepID=UPI003F8497A8